MSEDRREEVRERYRILLNNCSNTLDIICSLKLLATVRIQLAYRRKQLCPIVFA